MKIRRYLWAVAPLALASCVYEQPTPVTTTTVTREVTTAGPAPVVAGRSVVVTQAPPPVRVETQTVSPGTGYIWTRGHWVWTGAGYQWVAGTWVARPRASATWVDGTWVRRGDGWVWVDGRWM